MSARYLTADIQQRPCVTTLYQFRFIPILCGVAGAVVRFIVISEITCHATCNKLCVLCVTCTFNQYTLAPFSPTVSVHILGPPLRLRDMRPLPRQARIRVLLLVHIETCFPVSLDVCTPTQIRIPIQTPVLIIIVFS
jgi:hypothetical protein